MSNRKSIFDLICQAMEEEERTFTPHPENREVLVTHDGTDFVIALRLAVDPARGQVLLTSELPVQVAEECFGDTALAVCEANHTIAMGMFDFCDSPGHISYRNTIYFKDRPVTAETIAAVVREAVWRIDQYNDMFYALNKGLIQVSAFEEN